MDKNPHFHPDELDMLIPVSIELDHPSVESTVRDILEQNRLMGFTRFALAAPCGGWRSAGYPPRAHFTERAEFFKAVKEQLKPYGISCGWWDTLTIKSGPSDEFIRMVEIDGKETPFSSCPLDPAFRKRFAEDMAHFAAIAKPDFIILEDDYAIQSSSEGGCFCPYHLDAFAERTGKRYTREELRTALAHDDEKRTLLRKWCELIRDSLVLHAAAIREAVDRESPEIPIGTNQSGNAMRDGNGTEAISRALAGPNHTPFSRIYGVFYGGFENKDIPYALFNPLYAKQHIPGDFLFYHESDSFPHTRFFTASRQMKRVMAIAYSYGYDGSLFQTQQLLDDPNEEKVYGMMFARERARFNAVHRITRQCGLRGAEVCFDPFYCTADPDRCYGTPLWFNPLCHFGIPASSLPSSVAFLDECQATYWDDEQILSYLKKGVFLDGDAARKLCERGFSRYLGVEIGEDVTAGSTFRYDLGAREVLNAPFDRYSRGKNMPIAHMYAVGRNGKLLRMRVTDEKCEVISTAYTFREEPVTPAMTRYINEFGGRVVVMGMTLYGNNSQSLYNFRRQRLIQELLLWCADELAFVRGEPSLYTIMNEAEKPEADFIGFSSGRKFNNRIIMKFPLKISGMRELNFIDVRKEKRFGTLESVPFGEDRGGVFRR